METLNKAKYFIPIILTSILSNIVANYSIAYSLNNLFNNLFLGIILLLTPIIIAILIAVFSGYILTPGGSDEKYPFGLVLLLTAVGFMLPVLCSFTYMSLTDSRDCSGSRCGTGLEPLMPYMGIFIICLFKGGYAPFIGLCTAFFYEIGMRIKFYQYDRNQLQRYRR
jgi:hypothetical protein